MTHAHDDSVCNSVKCGEYNPLRCVRMKGHKGEHNYVVYGNYAEREMTPAPWSKHESTRSGK